MTTGIFLGVPIGLKEACGVAKQVGFIERMGPIVLKHSSVEGLEMQILEGNQWMPDEKDIRTIIEFDDSTERFPDNPSAIEVLRAMGLLIPGIKYCDHYFPWADPKPPVYPITCLFDSVGS